MNIKEEEEIKKEFQLERVVLFSDAVFAIIITIMVLEIKLPAGLRHAPAEKVREAFTELIPKVLGYITAFFLVGMFWAKHLKIFSYLKDYTTKLITFNLIFLFCISLFPFGVSIMTETLSPRNYDGLLVYFTVVLTSLLAQTALTGYMVKNRETLCIKPHELADNLEWKAQRLNFIAIPVLFAFVIIGSIYKIPSQNFGLGFGAWALTVAFIRKKFYPSKAKNDGPLLARLFKSRNRRTSKLLEEPEQA